MADQPSKITGGIQIQVQPGKPDLIPGTKIIVTEGEGVTAQKTTYTAGKGGLDNPLVESLDFYSTDDTEQPVQPVPAARSSQSVVIQEPFGKKEFDPGKFYYDNPSEGGNPTGTDSVENPDDSINYDDSGTSTSSYNNKSLEAVLNLRGLTSQRPEILGIFDFLHPIIDRDGDHLLSPAGELFDMQTQLKQLRYNEALTLISQLSSVSIYGSVIYDADGDDDPVAAELYLGGAAGLEWDDRIGEAEAVIEYLGDIYETVNTFIEGMDLDSMAMLQGFHSLTVNQAKRLEDMLSRDSENLYVSPPDERALEWLMFWKYPNHVVGAQSIKEFIQTIMDVGSGQNWEINSSQSTYMAQLYCSIITAYKRYPAKLAPDSSDTQPNAVSLWNQNRRYQHNSMFTDDLVIQAKSTLGPVNPTLNIHATDRYDYLTQGGDRTTATEDMTVNIQAIGGAGVGVGLSSGVDTDVYEDLKEADSTTGGGRDGTLASGLNIIQTRLAGDLDIYHEDSTNMQNEIGQYASDGDDFSYPTNEVAAGLLYMASLDLIRAVKAEQSGGFTGYISERESIIEEYQIGANNMLGFNPVGTGAEDATTKIRGVPGSDNFYPTGANRADDSSLIGRLYIKDKDTESTATIVGTFTDNLSNMPAGSNGNIMRSGRSYFTDEILTAELDEAKDRIDTLISKLNTNNEKLVSIYKKSRVVRGSDSGYDSTTSTTPACPFIGGEAWGTSSRRQGAYTMHAWFVETLDDACREMQQSWRDDEDYTYETQMFHMAQAMSKNRPRVARALLGLNMALYAWKYKTTDSGGNAKLVYTAWADTLWAEMLSEMAVNIFGWSFNASLNSSVSTMTTGGSRSDTPGSTSGLESTTYEYGNRYDSEEGNDYWSSSWSLEWQINVGGTGYNQERDFYIGRDTSGGSNQAYNAASYNPFRSTGLPGSADLEPLIHTVPAHTVGRFERSIRHATGGDGLKHTDNGCTSSTVKTIGRRINGNTRVYLVAALTDQILGSRRGSGAGVCGIKSTMKAKSSITMHTPSDVYATGAILYRFFYNKRYLCSIRNAVGVYQGNWSLTDVGAPGGDEEIIELYSVHAGEDWDKGGYSVTDGLCPGIWSQTNTAIEILREQTREFEAPDKEFRQMVALAILANKRLIARAESLKTDIDEISIEDREYGEALEAITSDPDFQNTAIFGTTRDQMMLSRALLDSIGQENRVYPYLPASKATMTQDCMQLASFSKATDLILKDDTDKVFIITVGITAGMLDELRFRAFDVTGNNDYLESNMIQIKIWRKDMLSDITYEPYFMTFDTSKFIFGGRKTHSSTIGHTGPRDHADFLTSAYTGTETYRNAKNSCAVRTYDPVDGLVSIYNGKAYEDADWVESLVTTNGTMSISAKTIFKNHANDFYLKQYIRQTQGYDVFEDTFPILEGNVFFNGPDDDKQAEFDEFIAELSESYSIRNVTDALNFDRIRGEIERSIVFSGEKYRNRIIYPKMFERTFCMFINTGFWEESPVIEGEFHDELPDYDIEFESIGSDQVRVQHGFNQYFVTVNILPRLKHV